MSRYIDADKALELVKDPYYKDFSRSIADITSLKELIEDIPTADVKPIVRGKWEHTTEPLGWEDVDCFECSVCGESWVVHEDFSFEEQIVDLNFCPHCGAEMKGADDSDRA